MTVNQRRDIRLHIEELVLDGFPSQDKNRIASAVRQELRNLLSRGDIPRMLLHTNDIPQLDAGTIRVRPGITAESTGTEIAQSLYGGLQK